jgi:transposase
MPANRMTMRKIKEVLRLKWACGLSHRQIARATGVSVGAVSQYAAMAKAAGLDWPQADSLNEDTLEQRLFGAQKPANSPGGRVTPDFPYLHRELRRKGVTLQLLWEEYLEANPGIPIYQYTQFCCRYRDWAATLKRSMRQQHRAGEKLFADFAGQMVPILDAEGGLAFEASIFVAVLGASNYTYACATRGQTTADWIGGMVCAMEYAGGVPELLVPDNPRAGGSP